MHRLALELRGYELALEPKLGEILRLKTRSERLESCASLFKTERRDTVTVLNHQHRTPRVSNEFLETRIYSFIEFFSLQSLASTKNFLELNSLIIY
jgi:hypothetical protein